MGNGITATISTTGQKEVKASELAIAKDAIPPTFLHDPVVQLLGWVVAIVSLVIAIGKPFKDYLRGERREDGRDTVNKAKDAAETTMYNQLAEQVTQYRKIADDAYHERNDLIRRVGTLEAQAEQLAEHKVIVEHLKERLDKKDEEIQQLLMQATAERQQFLTILTTKDEEIAKRDERILQLERGLRDLQLQILEDRAASPFVCPMAVKQRSDTPGLFPHGPETNVGLPDQGEYGGEDCS